MNRNRYMIVLVIFSFLFLCNCRKENESPQVQFLSGGSYQGQYWPTSGWRSCSPEEVGMNGARLMEIYDYVANPAVNTEGLVIIRDGYIVAEAYFGDFSIDTRHASYSVAKSFISALVGIAIDRGVLSGVDERVADFYPSWQAPGTETGKQNMQVRHLLTMASGLQWDESNYYDDTGENDAFLMGAESDYIQYVLNKPSQYEPGTMWNYSSGDSMLLSGIIQGAAGRTAYSFALENLLAPIGIAGITWDSDEAGHTVGGWGISATVREYAKFGYLYLNRGQWENSRVVPEAWVEASLRRLTENIDFYGYQWWLAPAIEGFQGSIVPPDMFLAWGIYTQQIFVLPSHNMVIVRVANDPGSPQWSEVAFLERILRALE
ncbi:MAG: serine hydrolase [bacterium]|nr:serine hydrolase [bacterium]